MNLTHKIHLPANQLADFLLSSRGIGFVVGKICLIASVGMAYSIGDSFQRAQHSMPAPIRLEQPAGEQTAEAHASLESYNIITARNIFGKKKAAAQAPVVQQAAPLKLRLVGTNVGQNTAPFAIIEDSAKGEQELFDVNQMVFNQAKLVEIKRDSVRLDRNGQSITLMLEEGGPRGGGDAGTPNPDATDFTVAEEELSAELANLPRLLSQARAVPYFRNGQSIGMRLFAIRKDSMYEKLGLQNGDIVKSVNDNSLSDPSQALKLFEQLKSERSISVTLERNGADRTVHYSIR